MRIPEDLSPEGAREYARAEEEHRLAGVEHPWEEERRDRLAAAEDRRQPAGAVPPGGGCDGPEGEEPDVTGGLGLPGMSRYILCRRCYGLFRDCLDEDGPAEGVVAKPGRARRPLRCDTCNAPLAPGADAVAISTFSDPAAYWEWENADLWVPDDERRLLPPDPIDVTGYARAVGILPRTLLSRGVWEKCVGTCKPPDDELPSLVGLLCEFARDLERRAPEAVRTRLRATPEPGTGPRVEIVAACRSDDDGELVLTLSLPDET